MSGRSEASGQFLGHSRQQVILDAAVIGSVAVVLVAVHLFASPDQKTALTVDSTDRTGVTLFTATYVHYGGVHLLTNVLGYLAATVMAYLLCLQSDRRSWFYGTFLAMLTVVPWVVNGGTGLLFARWLEPIEVSARGFSGVVAAFGGVVFVAAVVLVSDRHGRTVAGCIGGVLLSLLAIQGYLSWTGRLLLLLLGALTLGVTASTVGVLVLRGRLRSRFRFDDIPDSAVPVLFAYLLLATFVAGLFPADVVRNGTFLNVYAHAIGGGSGLIIAGVLAAFDRS